MADERDFELLDDYITHRMSEGDRSSFEQKIQADPDLQHEYALQQRLIQGIKDARVAELKSMLNNVAVPSGNPGNSLITKIMLGTVASLVIAAAGYWYFATEDNTVAVSDAIITEQGRQAEKPIAMQPEATEQVEPEQEKQQAPSIVREPGIEADKNQTSAGTEHSKPSLATRPDPLQAPGQKRQTADASIFEESDPAIGSLAIDGSSAVVETDPANAQYSFHYQFRDGKLLLFGPFEKNTYEVMELSSGEKRAPVLFYQDRFYVLDDADSTVHPLEPVTDPALLKKLSEYRSSK